MKKMIGMLGLMLSCQAASAQTGCAESITTLDLVRCEGRQLEQAERALNQAYGRAMKELAGPQAHEREARTLLRKAQRNWVAFREQDCAAKVAAMGGGSLQGVVRIGCMREHAESRTRQLSAFRPH